MDNLFYSQGKLREYADAFRRLMNVYGGGGRTALSLQLKETAAMLERILGDSEEQSDCIISEEQKGKLYDYLRSESINVSGILYLQPVKGRIEIVMRLSRKRGCTTAGQLAQDIGEILGKRFRAAEGSRRVLGKDEGEFIFEERTDYRLLFGHAGCSRGFARISGDNYSYINLEGGRSIVSLADGMGCGSAADEYSTRFIELLEHFLDAGFSEESALGLLNDTFADNDMSGIPVTIDMCSINEYEGKADFFKMGAVPSFIKSRDGTVRVVEASSLPAGVISGSIIDHESVELKDGDYIIMMSDGVLDALPFYDKEKHMKELIEGIEERMPQAIAERILSEVYFYDEKIADDMTVLVTGIWRIRNGE